MRKVYAANQPLSLVGIPLSTDDIAKTDCGEFWYSTEMADLYERYINRVTAKPSSDLHVEMICLAKKLLPALNLLRALIPYQQPRTADFIVESLNYIVAGKPRTVDVSVHGALLPKYCDGAERTKLTSAALIKTPALQEHYIHTWLNHEDGFDDMVCTLFHLFGKKEIQN